jgi:hypothetical protein
MTSSGGKSNHRKLSRKNNMNGVRATGTGVSDKVMLQWAKRK